MSESQSLGVVSVLKIDKIIIQIIKSNNPLLLKSLSIEVGRKVAWLNDKLGTVVGEIVGAEGGVNGDFFYLKDNKTNILTPIGDVDFIVFLSEKMSRKRMRRKFVSIIKFDSSIKSVIKERNSDVLEYLGGLGIEKWGSVAWFDENSPNTIMFGKIFVTEDEAQDNPVIWLKRNDYLLPLYEVDYLVLLK